MHRLIFSGIKHLIYGVLMLITRLRYRGKNYLPREGAFILCGNHLSWFDAIIAVMMMRSRVLHIMAKKELFAHWYFRWFFRFCFVFPIDRHGADVEGIKITINLLRNGEAVVIFPEGTRNKEKGQTLLPLEDGAIALAHRQNVPIIPFGRSKRVYRPYGKLMVAVGAPYHIKSEGKRLTKKEQESAKTEMTERIQRLMDEADKHNANH